jgi:hypothetical protein
MTIETFKKADELYSAMCEIEQQAETIEKMIKTLDEDKLLELKLVDEEDGFFGKITVGANTAKNILELLKEGNKKALQVVKQEFQEL